MMMRNGPINANVYGDYVYLTYFPNGNPQQQGTVARVSKYGGPLQRFPFATTGGGVAAKDGRVYWFTYPVMVGVNPPPTALLEMQLTSGAVRVVDPAGSSVAAGFDWENTPAVSAGDVFWANQLNLFRIARDGRRTTLDVGCPSKSPPGPYKLSCLSGLDIDGDTIFAVRRSDDLDLPGNLVRVPREGGEWSLVDRSDFAAGGIAGFTATDVFWFAYGRLRRVPKGGGPHTLLQVNGGFIDAVNDAAFVYWLNVFGELFRVPVDAEGPPKIVDTTPPSKLIVSTGLDPEHFVTEMGLDDACIYVSDSRRLVKVPKPPPGE